MTSCSRFAPSPTGILHIGSARTALYAWLFARHDKGQFILRIEDTDRERSTEESVKAIFDGMKWLGLDYDQGPYFQTQRFDRYKEVVLQLLAEKKAYKCYCTRDRLEKLRETQMANKEKPRYDGHCRELEEVQSDLPYVVRFKNPEDGEVIVHDAVYGNIHIQNKELDDLIIARTDGVPTYNFTVVVDDWDMQITHVIRGDDHINNTPRQINIFKALGAKVPVYAHIPMILGADGKKLSKRHGATGVMEYREMGYVPQALLNYLVRLGWSHGDQEIFSLDEMIEFFTLDKVNKSAAAMNVDKLNWLNQHYLKTLPPESLVDEFRYQLQKLPGLNLENGPALDDVIIAQRERCKTLKEMAEKSIYFYSDDVDYQQDEKALKNITPEILPALKDFAHKLEHLADWQPEAINELIKVTAETHELKLGKFAQPLRVAVTGGTVSPPLDVTIQLLGRIKSTNRLSAVIISG